MLQGLVGCAPTGGRCRDAATGPRLGRHPLAAVRDAPSLAPSTACAQLKPYGNTSHAVSPSAGLRTTSASSRTLAGATRARSSFRASRPVAACSWGARHSVLARRARRARRECTLRRHDAPARTGALQPSQYYAYKDIQKCLTVPPLSLPQLTARGVKATFAGMPQLAELRLDRSIPGTTDLALLCHPRVPKTGLRSFAAVRRRFPLARSL